VGSGKSLVTQMQLARDLQNVWIMFDHVKHVAIWTIMACHVYDLLRSDDHCSLWHAIWRHKGSTNNVDKTQWHDVEHDFPKLNFKGFMVNNTQANWSIVKIVYGSRHPFVRMIDKECTCLFHWIQSFDKHTKQLIKLEFQDQHISFCHQYKGAKSLGEVESLYVLICC
jgi:hypothetical protein